MTTNRPLKLLISANRAWNLAHFRKELIQALIARGHEVFAVAADDGCGRRLVDLGAYFRPLSIASSGLSPIDDVRLFIAYRRLMAELRPDAFLGFTVKPNIYGSLAAASAGIRTINNISGLGTAFIDRGVLAALVSTMYRMALRTSHRIFFQNADDMQLFARQSLVRPGQARLIPGSGVDVQRFAMTEMPSGSGGFRFLLIARLLGDKGVREFVEASRIISKDYPNARFGIRGATSPDNRSAIPPSEVDRWRDEGLVDIMGESADVRPDIAAADCVVLPSYREGLPRSLLEGAAMGKPLIATNVPGCRDVVRHGNNGLLCDVRSALSLASAMRKMLELPTEDRSKMGRQGRQMVEGEYSVTRVIEAYLDAIER